MAKYSKRNPENVKKNRNKNLSLNKDKKIKYVDHEKKDKHKNDLYDYYYAKFYEEDH